MGINGFDQLYSNDSNRMYMLPQAIYKQNQKEMRYVNNRCVNMTDDKSLHKNIKSGDEIEHQIKPLKVLIVGWVSMNLMYDIIVEFDRGQVYIEY